MVSASGSARRAAHRQPIFPEFFKVLKVDASLAHGDWADVANQVQAGSLDALAVAAGVPFPSFIDLEPRKGPLRSTYWATDPRSASRHAGTRGFCGWSGHLPSLRSNYGTVGLYNFAVAHRDVPADLAYAILEAVFANHDELVEVHSAAAETVPANFTRNTFLPFQTGRAAGTRTKVLLALSAVIERIYEEAKIQSISVM